MSIEDIIGALRKDSRFADNIAHYRVQQARPAGFTDLPAYLDEYLLKVLADRGINQLYYHQAAACTAIRNQANVVVSTGVASGKSLCYQLPILQSVLEDRSSCSLLLMPTRALAQDQKESLAAFCGHPALDRLLVNIGIYDSDTPSEQRQQIREGANIMFTNPDMLHLGILPHHTRWARFLSNLRYVIIDEVHIYRGIFGSHFANLIRRLKRLTSFYGSRPVFILTSATLANTREFCSRLLEEEPVLIDKDASPQGERHFLIYNPPLLNRDLGIRKRAMLETVALGEFLYRAGLQSLIFAHTRRMVEFVLSELREVCENGQEFRGYRSGYLAEERREIERSFREGDIRSLISTSAMELGIDIGGLDAVIINGYPGSITSVRQQSGRAGRQGEASLTIMVAASQLLDQYLVKHPEYLLERNPEAALIDPENPFILLRHLQCALFEKPFGEGEGFGRLTAGELEPFFKYMADNGYLHRRAGRIFWMADKYPAQEVSLRTAGSGEYLLQFNNKTIGTVDENSVCWLTHPEAVYLHSGEAYIVNSLDMEQKKVLLYEHKLDYYTQAQSNTEFTLEELLRTAEDDLRTVYLGNLLVIEQVTGYKKIKWTSNEVLGYGELDLPPRELHSRGFWLELSNELVELQELEGLWNNQAADYGQDWSAVSARVRERDGHACQVCGLTLPGKALDVHHIRPLRTFADIRTANNPANLLTLCPACHRKVEKRIQVQSGLAGLAYLLGNIAPLFLMCDRSDYRVHSDPNSRLARGNAAVIFHEAHPGGLGLAEKLFEQQGHLLTAGWKVVTECDCQDGCPACTGPAAEAGSGSRKIVSAILRQLV